MNIVRRFLVIVVALAATPAAVHADSNPWSRGVSADKQAAASTLFAKGNKFMDDALWDQALAEFRKALTSWDNPAIHGNTAICLIQTNKPIEAYKHMKRALKYGAAPFTAGAHRQLLAYSKLLNGQIAELDIRTTQPGTVLILDNRKVATGPGKAHLILKAGRHRIVANRADHRGRNELIDLAPGKHHQLTVDLESWQQATTYHRRFRPWKTWATLAGAGVLLAGATGLLLQADRDLSSYKLSINNLCPAGGCTADMVPALFTEVKDRGQRFNTAGSILLAAGITTALTAAVLWYLNRRQKRTKQTYPHPLNVGSGYRQ